MRSIGRITAAALAAAACGILSVHSFAQFLDLDEGFETITPLAPPATDGTVITSPQGSWIGALRSAPLGTTGIFQGSTAFPAHSGPSNSYAAMNFNNTSGVGTINTWLISPEVTLRTSWEVSFYTRTATGTQWPDRLELRMSTAGSSTNVGTGPNDVGDFTILLATVNPDLTLSGYPQSWTRISGFPLVSGHVQGRFALRYTVPNAGPGGSNSNLIGIDSFRYEYVPEPGVLGLLAGLSVLAQRRCLPLRVR